MLPVRKRAGRWLESVPSVYYKQAFFLLVLGYISLMMWDARTYGPTVRLFPVLIGIPLIALLIVQIVYPMLPDRLQVSASGLVERATDQGKGPEVELTLKRSVRMPREAGMILWVLILYIIMYFFGILAGLTLFVFAFIYYYERDIKLALGVMFLNLILSYGLFVQILQIRLFPGSIW